MTRTAQRVKSLPLAGHKFRVHVCADCGFIEGERPQAGCCPACGSSSKNVAVAEAEILRYSAGEYWPRDGAENV